MAALLVRLSFGILRKFDLKAFSGGLRAVFLRLCDVARDTNIVGDRTASVLPNDDIRLPSVLDIANAQNVFRLNESVRAAALENLRQNTHHHVVRAYGQMVLIFALDGMVAVDVHLALALSWGGLRGADAARKLRRVDVWVRY